MRLLVVGSCGKKKFTDSDIAPTCADLDSKGKLDEWQDRLKDLVIPARDMYTGNQSRELVKGVDRLRTIEGLEVTLIIISAGFGLVTETELIPPYECSFSIMNKNQIISRARRLSIPRNIQETVQGFDVVYLALGKNYLLALGGGWQAGVSGCIIGFEKSLVGRKYAIIPGGNQIVKTFSATGHKVHGAAGFKGDLLRILADHALSKEDSYAEVLCWTDPKYIRDLIFTIGGL